MKSTLLIFYAACFVCTGLNAANGDRFFHEMKNRIANWETTGVQKAWSTDPFVESYEFFLWDKTSDSFQWFVVQADSEGPVAKVIIYFGFGGVLSGSKRLDPNRAAHLLSEIGKSEIFRLPAVIADAKKPQVMFANTGLVFFLGRRNQVDRSNEVFRWVGESYPVDKVIDALTDVTVVH